MVLSIVDTRLVFLFLVVFVSVIILFFYYMWVLVKKEKQYEISIRKKNIPIKRLNLSLLKEIDIDKKLGIIGETVKRYFATEYDVPRDMEYSELIIKFDSKNKKKESEFCKRMFELYYYDNELTEEIVTELVDMLVEINDKIKIPKKIGLLKIINKIIKRKKDFVFHKFTENISFLQNKSNRKSRVSIKKKYESRVWINKMTYVRHIKKIFSNLFNHRKNNFLIKSSHQREDISPSHFGIAQRIVQREKKRLDKTEYYVLVT